MRHRPCPLCGRSDCRSMGEILHPNKSEIAGVPLDLSGQTFDLMACDRCGFWFKSPAIPEENLLACYMASSEVGRWIADPHYRRFDTMRDMLLRATGGKRGRILDIGCFHASFLSYLGDSWQRFGVEPSEGAARVARSKGIAILSRTLDQLPEGTPPFDVITAMDLIEHLNEPMRFFRLLHKHLTPGGVALFLTGDTDAWPWQSMKNLYWYTSLPEHCGFFNLRSLEFVGREVGLEILEYHRRGHARASLAHRTSDLLKNFAYLAGRACRGLGIPKIQRILHRRGPGWLSATDHMYVTLRKVGE